MERTRSICMFCSMGCGFILASRNGVPSHIEYDLEDPRNRGSLCPRGNSMIEMLRNPRRIIRPRIRIDGIQIDSDWDEAIGFLAHKLKEIKKKHGASSIGVIASPSLTNEELYLAGSLAKDVIKTPNFDIAFSSDDQDLIAGLEGNYLKETAMFSLNDLEDSDCILIIGDQLTKAPCSSKGIMNAKYNKKGTKVIALEPKISHTAWFATNHVRMNPSTEWIVLLGMIISILGSGKKLPPRQAALRRSLNKYPLEKISDISGVPKATIENAARDMAASAKGTIVISTGFSRVHPLTGVLAKVLASVSGGKKGILPFYSNLNSKGAGYVDQMIHGGKKPMTAPQMVEAAAGGRIKALISFGVDIISHAKWGDLLNKQLHLELLAVSDIFPNRTTEISDIVLPASSVVEKNGSVVLCDGSVRDISQAISPLYGSKSEFDIIERIMLELGAKESDILNIGSDIKKRKASKRGSLNELERSLKKAFSEHHIRDERPYILAADEDIVHFAEGSYTKKFFWPNRMCEMPWLEMNSKAAGKLGICNGKNVMIRSKNGKMDIRVKVTDTAPDGVMFSPAHFLEVRNMFGRNISGANGRLRFDPISVSIEKAEN